MTRDEAIKILRRTLFKDDKLPTELRDMNEPCAGGWVDALAGLGALKLSEPVRATFPNGAQVNSACLTYRHDFGLLDVEIKDKLRFEAVEWLHAWRKELDAAGLKIVEK